jgi:hypothetical protein
MSNRFRVLEAIPSKQQKRVILFFNKTTVQNIKRTRISETLIETYKNLLLIIWEAWTSTKAGNQIILDCPSTLMDHFIGLEIMNPEN